MVAMISLAIFAVRKQSYVHIKEIADEQSIPLSTLTQGLAQTQRDDLVRKHQQIEQWLLAGTTPEAIKLGEVAAIDGQNAPRREGGRSVGHDLGFCLAPDPRART